MAKNYLKVVGIINIVLGSIFILSIIGGVIGIPLLVNGIIYVNYSNLDETKLKTKKTGILIWSFVLILLNFISAIFSFIAYDKIGKDANKIDPKIRKLDIMLKLGTIMVILSGFILATSNWDFISDSVKVILLLCVSALFFILYIISNKFINIKSTKVIYYMLGWAFIVFSYIAIMYFKMFDIVCDKLSLSALFLIISASLFSVNRLFKSKSALHVSIISFIVSVSLLIHNYLSIGYLLIALTLFSALGSIIFRKNNEYKIDFDIALSLSAITSFVAISNGDMCNIERIILTIITVLILYVKAYITKETLNNIMFLTLSYLIVISNFINLDFTNNLAILLCGSLMTLTLLEQTINEKASNVSLIVTTTLISGIYLDRLDNSNSYYLNIILALFTLIPTLTTRVFKKKNDLISILEPINLALLIEAIRLCASKFIDVYTIDFAFITPLILAIISLFKKKGLPTNSYLAIIYILIFINLEGANIIPTIAFIVTGIMLYVKAYLNRNEDKSYIPLYVLALIISFDGLDMIGQSYDMIPAVSLIQMCILLLFSILNDNKVIKNITLFMVLIPYINLRDAMISNENITFILDYVLVLYYIVLISRFIKSEKSKANFLFIVLTFVLISLIGSYNVTSGVLAGIISLACIYIGFFNEKYDLLYKLGMIGGILNIIYKLKDLWDQIPFFVYLLVVGIVIIVFATIKQIKNQEK